MRALVVLLLLTTPVAAEPTLNLVQAAHVGCSDDFFTEPDLRVTVLLGDTVLMQESMADAAAPFFATHAPMGEGPWEITVRGEEAEPGFFKTVWEQCDVAPGPGTELRFSWDGSHQHIVTEGTDRAMRVELVLGPAPPPAPTLSVVENGPHALTVAWSGAANTTLRILGEDPIEATSPATIEDLCENSSYTLLAASHEGPWAIGSRLLATTQNIPPARPVIHEANLFEDEWNLSWRLNDTGDLDRIEIYAVNESRTLLMTVGASTFGTATVKTDAPAVVVRSVDVGGLWTDSASWHLGAPAREPIDVDNSCAGHGPYASPPADAPPTSSEAKRPEAWTNPLPSDVPRMDSPADNPPEKAAPAGAPAQPAFGMPPVGMALIAGAFAVIVATVVGVLVGMKKR